jgi:hypothetical protein
MKPSAEAAPVALMTERAENGRWRSKAASGRPRSSSDARRQKIRHADSPIHLTAHAIGDRVDDLGAILWRIDINAERALAEREINHPDDLACHFGGIGVGRL